jgi:hypothetical protein
MTPHVGMGTGFGDAIGPGGVRRPGRLVAYRWFSFTG